MKQAYILRREGRDYQAPDLETLQSWARDGRVLPADMVYSPRYQSWYRARDLRELRAYLPSPETTQKASARQQFWLRKGDQNYATDSLETILRWAAEGNIDPDDYIYHPSYGKWFRAGDSPQLASRFPSHLQRRNDGFQTSAAVRHKTEDLNVEHADSVTKTTMDMRSVDLQQLAKTRDTARASRGRAQTEDLLSAAPTDEQRFTGPLQDAPGNTAPHETAPIEITADEITADEIESIELAPDEMQSVEIAPIDVAPQRADASIEVPPDDIPPDEDAKFADTTGALKQFYDVARAFVVTRDLRPGEKMESPCSLPSTNDDLRGLEKKDIYVILADRMQTHLDAVVRPLEAGMAADNRAGFFLLISRAETLIDVIRAATHVVGQKPPERFVIGNRARPKMSPAEEEAMLRIDAALTGLISVRKR